LHQQAAASRLRSVFCVRHDMKVKLPVLVVFWACAGASAYAVTPSWSFEHAKVLNGEIRIKSACMMPSEARLVKEGMKGDEGMTPEAQQWSKNLDNVVQGHFKSAGVEVMMAADAGASGASQDEINQVMLQVRQRYTELSAKLDRKPKDIAKTRYTLGDEVALLPCAAKSDVLVFVEARGQVFTGGRQVFAALTYGNATNQGLLILTMADAKTGEILGYARFDAEGGTGPKFANETEKAYGKAIDKQFKKMRVGDYFSAGKH
jgi:hypothetical protein